MSLTTTTVEQYTRSTQLQELSLTFQHVVTLARLLHIPYVWIDFLCIVQDSSLDWEQESAKMAGVYGNALVVVIAASAATPSTGFLGPRARHLWTKVSTTTQSSGVVTLSLRESTSHDTNSLSGTVVNDRAWCFQERLMGQRRLVCCDSEIIWECRDGCKNESCSLGDGARPHERYDASEHFLPASPYAVLRRDRPIAFESDEHAYQFWKTSVEDFTRRGLTVPTDRLPAIAALATMVHVADGDQYLAGLWKGDILHELMWVQIPTKRTSTVLQSPEGYVAPTWSWASQPYAIMYWNVRLRLDNEIFDDPSEHNYDLALVACECNLSGASPFGAVNYGSLHLRVWPHDVTVTVTEKAAGASWLCIEPKRPGLDQPYNWPNAATILDGRRVRSVRLQGRETLQRAPATHHVQFTGCIRFLWLTQTDCLILALSQTELSAFERLGLLHMALLGAPRFKRDVGSCPFVMVDLEDMGYERKYDVVKLI